MWFVHTACNLSIIFITLKYMIRKAAEVYHQLIIFINVGGVFTQKDHVSVINYVHLVNLCSTGKDDLPLCFLLIFWFFFFLKCVSFTLLEERSITNSPKENYDIITQGSDFVLTLGLLYRRKVQTNVIQISRFTELYHLQCISQKI